MRGLIIIPAFNEEKVIAQVFKKIPTKINGINFDVLVINDGSTDNTEKVAQKNKIKVLTHLINRGLGAALGTGFEYARIKNYELLATIDGDGQHDPTEIKKLLKTMIKHNADFVVGTRVRKRGMPLTRKAITFFASFATYFFTGVWTTDSQSGFRIFSKKAIKYIKVDVDRMEVSSFFFRQAKIHKLKIVEVPIKPIYTKYSLQKGQSLLNSFNILGKLTISTLLR